MCKDACVLLARIIIATATAALAAMVAFGAPVPPARPKPPPLTAEDVVGRWKIIRGADESTHDWTMTLWPGGRYECAQPAAALRGELQYVGEWSVDGDKLTVRERYVQACPLTTPESSYTVTIRRGRSGTVVATQHNFLAGTWFRTE